MRLVTRFRNRSMLVQVRLTRDSCLECGKMTVVVVVFLVEVVLQGWVRRVKTITSDNISSFLSKKGKRVIVYFSLYISYIRIPYE